MKNKLIKPCKALYLLLVTIGLTSCSQNPTGNSTEKNNDSSQKKENIMLKVPLDSAILAYGNRNLPLNDYRNIDSINGFRGVKFGDRIDKYSLDSFQHRIYMNGLLHILSWKTFYLYFYHDKLARVERSEESFFILDDLTNTFGKPNIYNKSRYIYYTVQDWDELPYNKLKKGQIIKAAKESLYRWKSPSNIQIDYREIYPIKESYSNWYDFYRHYVYTITDMNAWNQYENERAKLLGQDKINKEEESRKLDSLLKRESQNRL